MNKEIYFCVDMASYKRFLECYFDVPAPFCYSNYDATEDCIEAGLTPIATTSLAHLSFDLITLGYDIYLCYKEKKVKIEPHMDLTGIGEPCKDLRFGHNIFKMFRAGIFDELLGIKK